MSTLRRTRPAVFDGLVLAVVCVAVLSFMLGAVIGAYAL